MRVCYLAPPLALAPTGLFPRHPPQFALHSAALLRDHGHEVAFVDAFHEDLSPAEGVNRALRTNPELVILVPYDYTRETIPEVTLRCAALLRALRPELPVGLVGSMDEALYSTHMEAEPGIDFALVGEYELGLLQIADQEHPDYAAVPGSLYRTENGVASNGPAAVIRNLDEMPWPAWDLIDFARYIYVPHRFRQSPMYPLLASRGCPFGCLCCKESKYSKIAGNRLRSVSSVMAEIHHAVAAWGAREIQFSDATFGMRKAWVHELCDALIDSGLGLTWSALSRVDVMTPELLDHMKAAGCWNVLYGLESANQHALDIMNKGIRVEQARPILDATRAAGIETTASFILGLPGESREDILRTIRWAAELQPDYAQFFVFKFYGDKDELAAWGTVDEEWDLGRFDFRGPVFVPHGIRGKEELKDLQKLAYRRFYFRPRYVLSRLRNLTEPGQLRRQVLGLYTLVKAVFGG